MRKHLLRCPNYIRAMHNKGISNSITREAEKNDHSQGKITFSKLDSLEKKKLDIAFAKACYIQALPFNIYESTSMKEALSLLNPAYNPPHYHAVASNLLDSAYESVKLKVDAEIATIPFLNVISDESTNINNNHIFNICLHISNGALHWVSEDIGAQQMTASNVATLLKTHLCELSNGNLQRINTVATDTCPTMIKVWEFIRQDPEFEHIFFISCNSHDLQLLMKDIVSLPSFKVIL